MKIGNDPPGFIMTSEAGSFAQSTMLFRKPHIIDNVIADNQYPSRIEEKLIRFKEEIASGKIQPLAEAASDVEEWNRIWLQFKNRTWLDVPWYFAEAYFYRRLLEIVEYFQPGPLQGHDPFQKPKEKELMDSLNVLGFAADALDEVGDTRLCLENLLHASLWGNRVDLSHFALTDEIRHKQAMIERENLIINDFARISQVFKERVLSNLGFINDNASTELGFDLLLADFLLRNNWAERTIFNLKPYPFFVSDAMPKDLHDTIGAFSSASPSGLRSLGRRLQKASVEERLVIRADRFWSSSYHFCEMPEELYRAMSNLDMVILKGDANYRRLLSDRHWPFSTPIGEITSYFPTSLLILRTMKAEIIVSLRKGQAERIRAKDEEWLINGKRGIIQYVPKF